MKQSKHAPRQVILSCDGSKCSKHGGEDIRNHYKKLIKKEGLKDVVWLLKIGCTDQCSHAPVLCFQPQNAWHIEVKEKEADELFVRYISAYLAK